MLENKSGISFWALARRGQGELVVAMGFIRGTSVFKRQSHYRYLQTSLPKRLIRWQYSFTQLLILLIYSISTLFRIPTVLYLQQIFTSSFQLTYLMPYER